MGVIKQSTTSRPVEHAIVLDLGDLAAEAQRLRDDAQRAAQELLADARRQASAEGEALAETARREGYDAGFAEGREAGAAEGRSTAEAEMRVRLDDLAGEWSAALEQWRTQRRAMLRQAREDVLRFALELARRVTHRIVETDPGVVEDQLREALALVGRSSSVEVAVHPDDRPLLADVVPALLEQLSSCDDLRLRDDAGVGRGGCIVRTLGGEIDARIDTQLQRIAESLVPGERDDGGGDGA